MTEFRMVDRAQTRVTRFTQDGFLIAEAFVAREGIQDYLGSEVGLPEKHIVKVYRPKDEVMRPASVRTYSHAPITLGHPSQFVTADNYAELNKGEVSTDAEWVDGKLRLPLIIKDAGAVKAIQDGTRELSAGYTCELEFKDGTTDKGEHYDAIQRNIKINHLAIVQSGRAGSECRIGDADPHAWGVSPITVSDRKEASMAELKPVVLGDTAVNVNIDAAAAIENHIRALNGRMAQMQADHATALATRDAALATANAERDAARAQVLSDADLDSRVAARADLVSRAKVLHPTIDVKGMSDAAIRRAVVIAKTQDASMATKEDAYIAAYFDAIAKGVVATVDPFAQVVQNRMGDGAPTGAPQSIEDMRAENEKLRTAELQRLRDAHLGERAKAN